MRPATRLLGLNHSHNDVSTANSRPARELVPPLWVCAGQFALSKGPNLTWVDDADPLAGLVEKDGEAFALAAGGFQAGMIRQRL